MLSFLLPGDENVLTSNKTSFGTRDVSHFVLDTVLVYMCSASPAIGDMDEGLSEDDTYQSRSPTGRTMLPDTTCKAQTDNPGDKGTTQWQTRL